MSVSAKTAGFPATCANSACGKALCGPVKHCPFCGVAAVVAPTPKAPPAVAPVVKPAALVAKAETPAPALEFDIKQVEKPPAAKPVPVPAAKAPAPERPPTANVQPLPPSGRGMKKVLLGVMVLGAVSSYWLYQTGARQTQQQFEQHVQAANDCLRSNQYSCALENAEQALQKDSKDPRAVSLLQRAQAGLEREQQAQQAQKAAEAARLAAQEQAKRDKLAKDADREREQQQRELDKRLQEQQKMLADKLREQQQQNSLPTTRPVAPRQNNSGANPGVLGQSLEQAKRALGRKDYQSAIAVANVVLTMDPGNRQALNIIRQAEQQRTQALNRTTIE